MKKKVLIVDNNKVMLRLLSAFMQQIGYEVRTAEDGLEALDVLESFLPGVVFVDLIMPRINGEKLCRIVRKMPELDGVFLVIISAIAAEEPIDFLSFGAEACIAKGPFSLMKENIATVLQHLENQETELLAKNVFGRENVFERGITKELLASKKHFEITLNYMDDGFLELTPEATVIYANSPAVRLLGLPEEKLLSTFFPDLFDPVHRAAMLSFLQGEDSTLAEFGTETPIFHHGQYLQLKLVTFWQLEQKYIIVLIHNITKWKEAELSLRNHQQLLEKLVKARTRALEKANTKLKTALTKVKTLGGLLPICASCKKIRDDQGYWNQIESFIKEHTDADFTHGLCPDCAKRLYPNLKLFKQQGAGEEQS